MTYDINVRCYRTTDLPRIAEIDQLSFDQSLSELDWEMMLRCHLRLFIAVAEIDYNVVGYLLLDIRKWQLLLERFATHPHYRRCGVATAIMARYKTRLGEKWQRLVADIESEDEPTNAFLRAIGFRACNVYRYPCGTSCGVRLEYMKQQKETQA